MHGGVNRWLSPELIATAHTPDVTPGPPGIRGAARPHPRAHEARGRPQQTRNRSAWSFRTLLLRAALVSLISACAAFSYVALSEAAAGLRSQSQAVAMRPQPAPGKPVAARLVRAPQEDESDQLESKLATAEARAHSLRETNHLMRDRLSELQAALERTPVNSGLTPDLTPDLTPGLTPGFAESARDASPAQTN
ncbi:MAG: hypothetical protein AAGI72_04260 [Pseudomonadota bacterium]